MLVLKGSERKAYFYEIINKLRESEMEIFKEEGFINLLGDSITKSSLFRKKENILLSRSLSLELVSSDERKPIVMTHKGSNVGFSTSARYKAAAHINIAMLKNHNNNNTQSSV